MLSELSKSLPRFRAYAEIFHTSQLHRALREVYDGFVNFCFTTIEVLQSNKCCMLPLFQRACWRSQFSNVSTAAMMRGRWAALNYELEQTRIWLHSASSDFEKEAQLADVQEQVKRQVEVMSKIGSMSSPDGSTLVYTDSITNVGLPRNHRFVRRVAVLALLHSELAPSFGVVFHFVLV